MVGAAAAMGLTVETGAEFAEPEEAEFARGEGLISMRLLSSPKGLASTVALKGS